MFSFRKILRSRRTDSSISQEIHRIDGLEKLLKQTLTSYSAAFESAARHLGSVGGEGFDRFRNEFLKVRQSVLERETTDSMSAARAEFDKLLKRYGKDVDGQFRKSEDEARGIVSAISAMADAIAKGNQQHSVRFRGIAKKLRLLSASDSISEIRQRISDEAGELEKYMDDMSRSTDDVVGRLREQVREVGRRRPVPDGQESAMAAVAQRARMGAGFGVIFLSVWYEEKGREGPGSGSDKAVAEEFPRRLADALKQQDGIFRWGHLEFLVLREGRLMQLLELGEAIGPKLEAPFRTVAAPAEIAMHVRLGAAEYIRGEPIESMLRRAGSTVRGQQALSA